MKTSNLAHVYNLIDELDLDAEGSIEVFDSGIGAVASLFEAYHSRLVRYLAQKLPQDLAENIAQEVWLTLHIYVHSNREVMDMSRLLWRIARNKRATAVDQLTRERRNYLRSLNENGGDKLAVEPPLEMWLEDAESLLYPKEWLEFVSAIPFLDELFSSSERVYWMLETAFGMKPSQIALWTGRSENVVYTTVSRAKQKIRRYLQSGQFETALTNSETAQARAWNYLEVPWFDIGEEPPLFRKYRDDLVVNSNLYPDEGHYKRFFNWRRQGIQKMPIERLWSHLCCLKGKRQPALLLKPKISRSVKNGVPNMLPYQLLFRTAK